ncbi:unnamed protein product [Musa textilis]
MKPGEEEEMSSDCRSGCQSGWTAYLEDEEEEEEEEGLSMVSDASSGPPQLREQDEQRCRCHRKSTLCVGTIDCLCPVSAPAAAMARDGCKKRRVGEEQHIEHSSVLADTATSPLFSYSKARFTDDNNCYYQMKPFNALGFTRSFSSAHLEVHFWFFSWPFIFFDPYFGHVAWHLAGEFCTAEANKLPSILCSSKANLSNTSVKERRKIIW